MPARHGQEAGTGRAALLASLSVPLLFGLYLLLTSTRPLIAGIWPYDVKRILQFCLLLILFLLPVISREIRWAVANRVSTVPVWLKFALAGIAGWGVVSALLNAQSLMHALNSLSEVALLSALVLGVFVVAACRTVAGRAFDRVTIALLALTGLAVGLQELIGVAAAHSAGVEFNFRVSLMHFSWPRFYNQVQSWMIPALVALPIVFNRYRLAYPLCLLVLGLQWYIILMTAARGSFVSILAAVSVAMIFLPAVRSPLLKWQTGGFVLGALIFGAVLFSFESGKSYEQVSNDSAPSPGAAAVLDTEKSKQKDTQHDIGASFYEQSLGRPLAHTSGRTRMWRTALDDSGRNPFFGIGPMNYVCTSNKRIGHPHNFPLQLAAEWGAPVALAVCIIAVFLAWRAAVGIRRHEIANEEDTRIAGLLLTGILAAGLHAGLSGIMVMPASQVTGLLMCGTLIGLYPGKPQRNRTTGYRWSFLPGAILALGLLVLGIHELRTMQPRAETLQPDDQLWPRIWQDAKVCQYYVQQNEVNN